MKVAQKFGFWALLLLTGWLLSACGTAQGVPQGEEVHDMGYVKVSKRELTTSVGNWDRSYQDTPNLTLADMLLRVPGVQVHGDNRNAQVTIRGVGSFYSNIEPLFVVDGMSVGFGYNSVSFLNPAEINHISVLKDSGAAIYGVRGANGVIIIETRKAEQKNKRRK